MNSATAAELLAIAARPARERIRDDHRKVPPRLKALFPYIEKHLFDPGLTVHRLRQACGKRDNSTASYFSRAVGVPPSVYIAERRLETAARLLRDTPLRIWQISHLTGFRAPALFSRRFRLWWGESPSRFRKRQRAAPAGELERLLVDVDALRQALSGRLPAGDVGRMLDLLGSLYPDLDQERELRQRLEPAEKPEAFLDDELWTTLGDWGSSQDERTRARLRFAAPALFHLLRLQALAVLASDRRQAVELADKALRVVTLTEEAVGQPLPDLRERAVELSRRVFGDEVQDGGEEPPVN